MKLGSFTATSLAHKVRVLWDRFQGLDFSKVIEPEDVGLDPKYAYRSSPSGNQYLVNVLLDLNITAKDSIIDIGCGKGSAMRTMLKFPFARVEGVELSEHIAAIAVQNFRRLNAKRTKIFVCDASQFSNYDAYNIVYLYNPFPCAVMSCVVDALIQSVRRSERELVIIYNNATCHDAVIAQGVFKKIGIYPNQWGNMISVYSNRDVEHSRLSANNGVKRTPGY